MKARFEGETEEDSKLWHTFFHWARQKIVHLLPVGSIPAIIDNREKRIPEDKDRALQAIIFTAFALEYRLKRVLECAGKLRTREDSLQSLIERFWKRLSNVKRFDGKGNCVPPEDIVWVPIKKELLELAKLRDFIAHARYEDIHSYCSTVPVEKRAKDFYLKVIDAIKIINIYTGDEERGEDQLAEHFRPLKTRPPGSIR